MFPVAFAKVVTRIDIEVSECAIQTDSAFVVVVSMQNSTRARIPPHIVIHQSEAPHSVDIQVAETESAKGKPETAAFGIGHRTLVAQGHR